MAVTDGIGVRGVPGNPGGGELAESPPRSLTAGDPGRLLGPAKLAFFGVLLVVFSLSVSYLALVGLSPGGAPSVFGHRLLIVLTGSMNPTFRAGDLVVVSGVSPAQVSVGDVITFRHALDSSLLVTHRVVKVIWDGDAVFWRTRGDANRAPDPVLVTSPRLVGRVEMIIPYAGYLAGFVRTRAGFFSLVILPGAALLWALTERHRRGGRGRRLEEVESGDPP